MYCNNNATSTKKYRIANVDNTFSMEVDDLNDICEGMTRVVL